ncbi:conserved hypothetical protein [Ricinus communis]|uniref:Uncharacterized protein n=1 Tax=Ricinus communis TaxID=3988 RepID=B9SQF6_RICCO|nr:conserved hypothetical protein [Ricinus communis]
MTKPDVAACHEPRGHGATARHGPPDTTSQLAEDISEQHKHEKLEDASLVARLRAKHKRNNSELQMEPRGG